VSNSLLDLLIKAYEILLTNLFLVHYFQHLLLALLLYTETDTSSFLGIILDLPMGK